MYPTICDAMETNMAHGTELEPLGLRSSEKSTAAGCANEFRTQSTELAAGCLQSTHFAAGARSVDEAEDLLLIQMRYDEHLGRCALERLCASGELEGLWG